MPSQPDQDRCVNSHNQAEDCTRASAQATIDQARYAYWQTIIGIFGVAIGAFTLIAAFAAARWAKAAAEHTQSGNTIARDAMKHQLRAYLIIEPGGVNEAENGLHRVPLVITNSGQTPALSLETFGDFLIVTGKPREFKPANDGRYTGQTLVSDQIIGASAKTHIYAYCSESVTSPFLSEIEERSTALIHYGFVRYRDVFNDVHETHFAFYHWGAELSDTETKRCRFGNHAT